MFFPLTLVWKLLIYRFFFLHGGGNEAACPTPNVMQHTKKHIRASRRTAYVFWWTYFNPREVSYCSVFNFSFIFFHILEAVLYLSIRNNRLLPDYILCHEWWKTQSWLISILLTDAGLWRWSCSSSRICRGKTKSHVLGGRHCGFWTRQPWKHKIPRALWSMSDMHERAILSKNTLQDDSGAPLHFSISNKTKTPLYPRSKEVAEHLVSLCCFVLFCLLFVEVSRPLAEVPVTLEKRDASRRESENKGTICFPHFDFCFAPVFLQRLLERMK